MSVHAATSIRLRHGAQPPPARNDTGHQSKLVTRRMLFYHPSSGAVQLSSSATQAGLLSQQQSHSLPSSLLQGCRMELHLSRPTPYDYHRSV